MSFDITNLDTDLRLVASIIALVLTTIGMCYIVINTRPLLRRSATTPRAMLTNLAVGVDYPIGMIPLIGVFVALQETNLYAMILINVALDFTPFMAWLFKYRTILPRRH